MPCVQATYVPTAETAPTPSGYYGSYLMLTWPYIHILQNYNPLLGSSRLLTLVVASLCLWWYFVLRVLVYALMELKF